MIHDCRTPLEALEDPETVVLEARLFDAKTWTARAHLLQSFLLGRLEWNKDPSLRFQSCLNRILETKGRWPLARIAREEGLGPRHLHRLFIGHLGASPKAFSRVVRFQAALRRLSRGTWQDVEGFCDQSHLIHEFQALYGDTPRAFHSRFIQDETQNASYVSP
jgi:AraC-like DNA-binding protein